MNATPQVAKNRIGRAALSTSSAARAAPPCCESRGVASPVPGTDTEGFRTPEGLGRTAHEVMLLLSLVALSAWSGSSSFGSAASRRPSQAYQYPAATRSAASPMMYTCRLCKASYTAETNGPTACRHHPGTLRGESARKGDWEGRSGAEQGQSGDLVYSWTCCGAPADAPGCVIGFHQSYDDVSPPPPPARASSLRACASATTTSTRESLLANARENDETLPQSYFAELDYDAGGVPWDLRGRPQPPVRNAYNEGAFGAPGTAILDCGCGAGDNANWLAARGYEITGFDLSPSAVSTALARASEPEVAHAITEARGSVEFVQASAVDLAAAQRVQARARDLGGFEIALDSAMLHCLDDESQNAFIEGVRPLMRAGGRLFIGCFSDANPDPWSNPRRISENRMRELLSPERGWQVRSLDEAWYERPAERSTSGGGAWTMAWWCVAEAV